MYHVLVIEDHPLVAQRLADMVLSAGASSVAIADSQDDAIDAALNHAPRMILSDVDLGSGGRGPCAVATIRERVGPVPTVFVTGSPDDEDVRACATTVLVKPVTVAQLAPIVTDVLRNGADRRFAHRMPPPADGRCLH